MNLKIDYHGNIKLTTWIKMITSSWHFNLDNFHFGSEEMAGFNDVSFLVGFTGQVSLEVNDAN